MPIRRPDHGCHGYSSSRNSLLWAFSSLVVQHDQAARIARIQAASTGGIRPCLRRVAGCAPPTGSAGHAGATANLKLTLHLDHSVGANQRFAAGYSRSLSDQAQTPAILDHARALAQRDGCGGRWRVRPDSPPRRRCAPRCSRRPASRTGGKKLVDRLNRQASDGVLNRIRLERARLVSHDTAGRQPEIVLRFLLTPTGSELRLRCDQLASILSVRVQRLYLSTP